MYFKEVIWSISMKMLDCFIPAPALNLIGNPEYVTVLCNKVYIMHIDNQLEIYFILKKT